MASKERGGVVDRGSGVRCVGSHVVVGGVKMYPTEALLRSNKQGRLRMHLNEQESPQGTNPDKKNSRHGDCWLTGLLLHDLG